MSACLIGLALPSAVDGTTVQGVGFVLWFVGVLLVLDGLGGRQKLLAQLLWSVISLGVITLIFAAETHEGFPGEFAGVPWILTSLLALAAVSVPRPKDPLRSFAADLRDRIAEASLPEYAEDPSGSIAKLQTSIASYIDQVRSSRPREADLMERALRSYRTAHGNDIEATSTRPMALRIALDVLVHDLETLRQQVPVEDPGASPATMVVGHARRMANIALGRVRK